MPISEGAVTALAVRFDLKSYLYGYLDAQVCPSMNSFASADPCGGMCHQETEENCNTSLSTAGADRDRGCAAWSCRLPTAGPSGEDNPNLLIYYCVLGLPNV